MVDTYTEDHAKYLPQARTHKELVRVLFYMSLSLEARDLPLTLVTVLPGLATPTPAPWARHLGGTAWHWDLVL